MKNLYRFILLLQVISSLAAGIVIIHYSIFPRNNSQLIALFVIIICFVVSVFLMMMVNHREDMTDKYFELRDKLLKASEYYKETSEKLIKYMLEHEIKEEFIYPGYMSSEAQEFFKGYIKEEERDGCAVVVSFIKLADGTTKLPSKNDVFIKTQEGIKYQNYDK